MPSSLTPAFVADWKEVLHDFLPNECMADPRMWELALSDMPPGTAIRAISDVTSAEGCLIYHLSCVLRKNGKTQRCDDAQFALFQRSFGIEDQPEYHPKPMPGMPTSHSRNVFVRSGGPLIERLIRTAEYFVLRLLRWGMR